VWTKSTTSNGYGQIANSGRPNRVHRVAYEHLVGPIPPGMHLDHLCRNLLCCNPLHLEPVSQGENTRRGVSHARRSAAAKVKTHCARGHELTDDNVYVTKTGARSCRACKRIAEGVGMGPGQGTWNAAKTHCPSGHRYDEANTYISPRGGRLCRECNRLRSAQAHRRKRE